MTTLAVAAMTLLAAACADDYDDSALWDKVNDHEERLAALEKWQEQTNQSIAAMQELLNTTDMITGVTAVTEDGETVGYTITFLHSDPITIYNGAKGADGEDGADGQTPQIGLAQAADGNWYWTLNGETLTDADGNPIRANGLDGEDGEDGATGPEGPQGDDGTSAPTPKILLGSSITSGTIETDNGKKDNNAWYLSVDGGATWYRVSGTDGADGDTWFAEAPKKEGNYYVFTLANDGSSFKVAAYQPFCIQTQAEKDDPTTFDNATLTITAATTFYLSIDEGIEYSSIVAQATPVDDDAVLTRADGWSAKVAESTDGITVTVTPGIQPYALLDVSLILKDGGKLTASRLLKYDKGYTISGDGKTYIVTSANGLLAWNEAAQKDLSINCTLAADITLTGEWTPIGTEKQLYTGTFDGNDKTITGLTINQSGTDYVGLICHLGSGGTVKNLTLENVDITGQACVGSVVGWNDGTVAACTVSGNVMGPGDTVGGVVGFNYYGSTLIACYATCSVNSYGYGTGGVAGRNYGTMTACYHATGSVLDSEDYIGGVVGRNYDTVTACYWKNNQEQGIGDHLAGTIGETTKVDGTTVTWQTAVDAMNAALQYSEWRYELTGALPTLKKQ